MNKLLAVLGFASFTFHGNFWDVSGKKHVKLQEEDLQKIEDALEKNAAGEDATALADLQAKITGYEANETAVQEALTNALTMNGLEFAEGQTVVDAIASLGTTCKEYGKSKDRGHNQPKNDGQEKAEKTDELVEGFFDPTAPHNQIN